MPLACSEKVLYIMLVAPLASHDKPLRRRVEGDPVEHVAHRLRADLRAGHGASPTASRPMRHVSTALMGSARSNGRGRTSLVGLARGSGHECVVEMNVMTSLEALLRM